MHADKLLDIAQGIVWKKVRQRLKILKLTGIGLIQNFKESRAKQAWFVTMTADIKVLVAPNL